MKHSMPEPRFARNALEPELSAGTTGDLCGEHHAAHAESWNGPIPARYQDLPPEEIVNGTGGAVFNNAGQMWNRNSHGQCPVPDAPSAPRAATAGAIGKDFGKLEGFRDFSGEAAGKVGSGWTRLTLDAARGLNAAQHG